MTGAQGQSPLFVGNYRDSMRRDVRRQGLASRLRLDNASFHSHLAQLIQSVAVRLDPCRRTTLRSPTVLESHRATGHLVKKSTPMCKIFLFGANAKSHDRHSSVACDSRPGLLRVCTGLSGDARIANAPQGTPNRNILHIGAKKTTTCRR